MGLVAGLVVWVTGVWAKEAQYNYYSYDEAKQIYKRGEVISLKKMSEISRTWGTKCYENPFIGSIDEYSLFYIKIDPGGLQLQKGETLLLKEPLTYIYKEPRLFLWVSYWGIMFGPGKVWEKVEDDIPFDIESPSLKAYFDDQGKIYIFSKQTSLLGLESLTCYSVAVESNTFQEGALMFTSYH